PFFVLPWLLIPLFAWLPDPANPAAPLLTGNRTLLTILGLGLAAWGAYAARLLLSNPQDLARTENHPTWTHMYLQLMSAQAGFALAYLFLVVKLAVPRYAAAKLVPPSFESDGYRVAWSGLSLTFDEKTLNAIVGQLVERIPDLKDLKIQVAPGELAATAVIHRFGVPLSAKAILTQLRLKDGFLAFVLDRVQALSFIPIPDQLLTYLVQKAPAGLLTYYSADRIMVVNLNDWLPAGMDLSLEKTVFEKGALTLQFA